MGDPQASPISQLLNSLGLTRDDLNKRSDQMRQFLVADSGNSSRVFDLQNTQCQANSAPSSSTLFPAPRIITQPSSSPLPDASARPPEPETQPALEPTEELAPQRQTVSMESVIERQRLARKEKRGKKEKDRAVSLRRSASQQALPVSREHSPQEPDPPAPSALTPQQSRYYREHTAEQTQVLKPVVKTEAESPVVPKSFPQPSLMPYYQYTPYVVPYYPVGFPATAPQVTPQSKSAARAMRSPLPPSSPPQASPPSSSPVKVNIVSSPGPIGPAPREDEYEDLPFKLPPGPYSPNKPDASYAAILGQAILSSPEHRLTLQEIYDWITIVYPYFKRGETTWMNSIRHVLSTTACFRKVVRDRSVGRTHWAIWDEDLNCFKNGKFRKEFCKDMQGAPPKSKRKKEKDEDDSGGNRKSKKARKGSKTESQSIGPSSSLPLFPPSNSQQSESVPSEVMFPPVTADSKDGASMEGDETLPPTQNTSSSPSSVPELVSNSRSSSSPPPSTSDFDTLSTMSSHNDIGLQEVSITGVDVSEDEDDGGSKVVAAEFWGDPMAGSSKDKSPLKSGIKLKMNLRRSSASESDASDIDRYDESDDEYKPKGNKKKKQKKVAPRHSLPLLGLPPSPTPARRANKGKAKDTTGQKKNAKLPAGRSPSPDSIHVEPSTPPRNRRKLQLSPMHTPLSHKGLHMSPTASLAHYKNHLNPPPPVRGDEGDEEDPMKTPSRKRPQAGSSSAFGLLSTPARRLIFSVSGDSPFRTPGGLGGSNMSPFRMGIYDPNDPMAMLDEELTRMGESGRGDSPGGLFGKSRLLYDSPNNFGDSPGRYGLTQQRFW